MEAGPHVHAKHGCAAAAVQHLTHDTPAPASSRVPAALLVVFALAPDPAVGVHTFAAALAAKAPDAVMLADVFAAAVLACAIDAVMLENDRRCWHSRSPCIGSSGGCARTSCAPSAVRSPAASASPFPPRLTPPPAPPHRRKSVCSP